MALTVSVFTLWSLALLLTSSLPAFTSLTLNPPAVFNFGDSNSDTGGLTAGMAFPLGLPFGQTYFLKPSGRLCDGRLIVDFLMEGMSLPMLNPYLDSVGAPRFKSGCNFATGGSTIQPANAASTSPFSFNVQVSQFVRLKAKSLELLSNDKSLQSYLPLEDDLKRGLYMIDIGQNDIDGAFYSKTEEQVAASTIPTIVSELKSGLEKLYNEGARNFWVHNTGPLGCLPRIIATYGSNLKVDGLGCVESHNRAANVYNQKLMDLVTSFKEQFPDTQISYVDIYSIKRNLISNFTTFGFAENIEACCGYGGAPLNYDSRIACSETKNLGGSMVTARPCQNTTQYINWDGNHYTEAANKFVSNQILAGFAVTSI